MKKILSLFAVATLIATTGFAAEEGFEPSGSPFAKVFFNNNYDFGSEGADFELKRAYLGYKYDMTETFSAKINIDVGAPEVNIGDTLEGSTNNNYAAFLKNAYLRYKKDRLTIDVGMIGLKQFSLYSKILGKRYISKDFQDLSKMGTSADLGVSLTYKFADFLSADLTVRNGEGYKSVESDDAYSTALGFTLKPIKGLTIRGFYDYIEKQEVMLTISHLVAYQYEDITVGIEYDMQSNHKDKADHDLAGYSAFATYDISKQIQLFGRYDNLSSNTLDGETDAWNHGKDGQRIITGVQYSPYKKVQIALNYQGFASEAVGKSHDAIFMNLQFAF